VRPLLWEVDWRLYAITDDRLSGGGPPERVMEEAVLGGAGVVQLRDKESPSNVLYSKALLLRRLCYRYGVAFIVNDRLDVALAAGADGVHIGRDDLPLEAVRRTAGPGMMVGVSVSSLEEAEAAVCGGADYLGVGPIFPTGTKPDAASPTGPGLVAEIKRNFDIPVVAIGGINLDNLREVVSAGADGVAVISALLGSENVREAARRFVEEFDRIRRGG